MLQGRFNVYNCLAAAGACSRAWSGLSESIVAGLGDARSASPGVSRTSTAARRSRCWSTTHTRRMGSEASWRRAGRWPRRRVIHSGGVRRRQGPLQEAAYGQGRGTELSDLCVITSDNPRGEEPRADHRDDSRGCQRRVPAGALHGRGGPQARHLQGDRGGRARETWW